MKRIPLKFFISIVVLTMFFSQVAHAAVTIKIGTIAPMRSPWVKELKRLGQQWKKMTDGKVKIKIYAGGIAGSEEDMARKMRMGVLGGAVFTNVGLTSIYKDYYILTIPFFLNSDDELDYMMKHLTPRFSGEIDQKGFKVLAFAKAGWIYFFSKNPIVYPKDLKQHKISFSTGTPLLEQAWKKSGYHVIPNELKDMMMGLQSGMVNAFYLPPLMAASGQYFALAPHMCSIKIAPLVGGVVFSNKIWNKIPEQYREKMIEMTRETAETLYQNTIELEKNAIKEMKKHGLKIHQVPQDAFPLWYEAANKGMDVLIGKLISKEIYDEAVKHLNDFRKKQKKQ